MTSNSVPRYYWDACIWIELITQQNAGRVDRCKYVIEQAEAGDAELWTSTFTLAEVWKRKCGDEHLSLPRAKDNIFEDFIEREFVRKIQVDVDVGMTARRLLRQFEGLGKPQDAIHVASCLLNNIDEMHTFDGDDLIKFDGQIPRIDRVKLTICPPPERPDSTDNQSDMFNENNESD